MKSPKSREEPRCARARAARKEWRNGGGSSCAAAVANCGNDPGHLGDAAFVFSSRGSYTASARLPLPALMAEGFTKKASVARARTREAALHTRCRGAPPPTLPYCWNTKAVRARVQQSAGEKERERERRKYMARRGEKKERRGSIFCTLHRACARKGDMDGLLPGTARTVSPFLLMSSILTIFYLMLREFNTIWQNLNSGA